MGDVELVNGERTRIRETGGHMPALVLVHGLANSIEIWDRVVPRLAERGASSNRLYSTSVSKLFETESVNQAQKSEDEQASALGSRPTAAEWRFLDHCGIARRHAPAPPYLVQGFNEKCEDIGLV